METVEESLSEENVTTAEVVDALTRHFKVSDAEAQRLLENIITEMEQRRSVRARGASSGHRWSLERDDETSGCKLTLSEYIWTGAKHTGNNLVFRIDTKPYTVINPTTNVTTHSISLTKVIIKRGDKNKSPGEGVVYETPGRNKTGHYIRPPGSSGRSG